MTDYTKIVRALRYCVKARNCEKCAYRINNNSVKCRVQRVEDAADAIDKITTMYEKAEMDATNLTGKLAQAEAEVERLKDSNEELREKQTYIDHYGDKWMTSAKDVPTAAYKHGYMDGMDEAKAQLPKRGEWIWKHRHHGGFKTAKGKCECGRDVYAQIDERYETDDPYCPFCGVMNDSIHLNYCPNCGAKMEVQE